MSQNTNKGASLPFPLDIWWWKSFYLQEASSPWRGTHPRAHWSGAPCYRLEPHARCLPPEWSLATCTDCELYLWHACVCSVPGSCVRILPLSMWYRFVRVEARAPVNCSKVFPPYWHWILYHHCISEL